MVADAPSPQDAPRSVSAEELRKLAPAEQAYEIANQLAGCVDRSTPEREAAFMLRIGKWAASLGDLLSPSPVQRDGDVVDALRATVDLDELSRLHANIPPGPYHVSRSATYEVRQIDTDPTNKHHWPYRLCQSIAGQKAACDEAVFSFIAGVINAWPQIAALSRLEAPAAMGGEDIVGAFQRGKGHAPGGPESLGATPPRDLATAPGGDDVPDEVVREAFRIYAEAVGLKDASMALRAKCINGLRAVLKATPLPAVSPDAGLVEADAAVRRALCLARDCFLTLQTRAAVNEALDALARASSRDGGQDND